MRIDVPLLRRLNACDEGIARFRAEFRHKPIVLTEDFWEGVPCNHLTSSDWSWLASRLLHMNDMVIFTKAVQDSRNLKIMRDAAWNDWSHYCRVRSRVNLAILCALLPLCDLRR